MLYYYKNLDLQDEIKCKPPIYLTRVFHATALLTRLIPHRPTIVLNDTRFNNYSASSDPLAAGPKQLL